MAISTGINTSLLRVYLIRQLIPRLEQMLQYHKVTKPATLPEGDHSVTARWNVYSNLTGNTTPLTEGTNTEGEVTTITSTGVEATVAEYGQFVKRNQLMKRAMSRQALQEFGEVLAFSQRLTMDNLVMAAASATTNYFVSHETATNTGTVATTDTLYAPDLVWLSTIFKKAYAWKGLDAAEGAYCLIIDPEPAADIMTDVTNTRLSWANIYQNTPEGTRRITEGAVGKIGRMAVFETNINSTAVHTASTTPASASGTVTSYVNYAFADYGVGSLAFEDIQPDVIVTPESTPSISNPYRNLGALAWHMVFVAKLLDSTRVIKVYTAQ